MISIILKNARHGSLPGNGCGGFITTIEHPSPGSFIMEEWKNISGYDSIYQISRSGIIKKIWKTKETIIKTRIRDGNYYSVDLTNNGVKKQWRIHVLLAATFIDNPQMKPEVNHRDGNKLNNNLSNLEWVTHKENMNHAFDSGLCPFGEKHTTKLNNNQVKEIRSKYIPYKYPCSKIAKEYSVCEGTIYSIVKRINWKRI